MVGPARKHNLLEKVSRWLDIFVLFVLAVANLLLPLLNFPRPTITLVRLLLIISLVTIFIFARLPLLFVSSMMEIIGTPRGRKRVWSKRKLVLTKTPIFVLLFLFVLNTRWPKSLRTALSENAAHQSQKAKVVKVSSRGEFVLEAEGKDFRAEEAPTFGISLTDISASAGGEEASPAPGSVPASLEEEILETTPSAEPAPTEVPAPVPVPAPATTTPPTATISARFEKGTNLFGRLFAVFARGPAEELERAVRVEVFNSQGGKEGLAVSAAAVSAEEVEISIDKGRAFRPGRYTLRVVLVDPETGEEIDSLEQDFTWGVLAINPNKSIYLPQETAQLAMAVLDEEGMMVCDAQLQLKIKSAKLKVNDALSTEDGTILVNPECEIHGFTLNPDYEAEYEVAGVGVYELELTTETENGTYTITDSFEVRGSVPFDVERESATRIYPPAEYSVTFYIKSDQDFAGVLEESVPASFEVTCPTLFQVDSGAPSDVCRVREEGEEKKIFWEVAWEEGETHTLQYRFLAPNISPQFYLLGPLKFIENGEVVFEEIRQWQIAVDTPVGPNNPSSAGESTITDGYSWSGYTNVYANDDVDYATVSLSKNEFSHYIKATGFNFSLPNCDSIEGIYVEVDRHSNDAADMEDYSVRLVNGSGTIVGDDKAIVGDWPTSDAYQTYGGSTDTWTAGLNCGDVTNANFGVVFAVQNTVPTKPRGIVASVDHIRVTVYYTIQTDSWTGTVYTDDDEGTTIADDTSICAVVNNGTPACSTTTSGVFTINTLNANAADQLTFFIDGGSILGNTVTVSDGGDIAGGDNLRIYQNHVLVRDEQGTGIDITEMDAYDSDQNPDDMLFDAEDSDPDTLSVESNIELFVYNSHIFTPGGIVTTTGTGDLQVDDSATFNGGTTLDHAIAGNLIIDTGATFNAPSTVSDGTITLNGNFTNGGTFNAGSGKIIFAGGDGSTQIISGSSTFYDFEASTSSNASGRTLQFVGNSTQTVSGTWTITGYSGKVITLQSSDTNNWTINPTAASVTYVDVYRSTNTGVNFCATYSAEDVNTVDWSVSAGASCNQSPNSPSSSAQKKTDDSTLNVGDWTNETSVKFTASADDPDNPDTLYLCVEKDPIGVAFSDTEDLCGSGIAYSGSPVAVTVTITSQTDDTEYHWQARTKDEAGAYSAWVSYGGNSDPNDRDYGIDTSAPTGGTVYDGTEAGVDKDFNDGSLSSLSANWSGFDATVSGLDHYDYSIGTTQGGTDIKAWTDNSTTTSVTTPGLTLQTSQVYYFNVRAVDSAGNTQSPVISSDGQIVSPSLSFGISPATVIFDNLNAANSYTDTETATLTTSTNAYNGYLVRAFATDYLRSTDTSFTISDFDGGTYASPDEWLTGDRGFGYNSSDTTIQGSNKFNSDPCPGGNSPPCYAPLSQTGPGDIVADHTNNVTGSPISGEEFTITYKVKTGSIQEAATYVTTVVYTVTAQY